MNAVSQQCRVTVDADRRRKSKYPLDGTASDFGSYSEQTEHFDRSRKPQTYRSVVLLGELDLNVNTARELQFGECVYRLLSRRVNFNQALVGAQLKLLPRFLIYVRRAQHCKNFFLCRQRNRASYNSTTRTYGLDDFLGGLVHEIVIVRAKFNANFLIHYLVYKVMEK